MRSALLLSVVSSFIISLSCQAQTNYWTWVNGDSVTRKYGIYGNKGVSSPLNKPGTRDGSVTWVDNAGNLWLFGGHGYNANSTNIDLNDLWKYDPAANEWTWVKGDSSGNFIYGIGGYKGTPDINNKPGAMSRAVSWKDNAGNLWLFGGIGDGIVSSGDLNELWKYDIATNMWTWVSGYEYAGQSGHYGTKGVTSTSDYPGARNSSCSWTDHNGNLWLFSGRDLSNHYFNDLWKYDIANNTWTWMSGESADMWPAGVYGTIGVPDPGNKPCGRYGSLSWLDNSGNLWLLGGFRDGVNPIDGYYNDLWKYNISSGNWTWVNGDNTTNKKGVYGTIGVANAANRPGARAYGMTWADMHGNLWMLGGSGYNTNTFQNTFMNDLWRYNIAANQWAWIKGDNNISGTGIYGTKGVADPANKPGGRNRAAGWVDAANTIWLFGGTGNPHGTAPPNYLNDLWSFSPISILPLHLLSFDGQKKNNQVLLNWRSADEINMSHFVITRSVDGRNFAPIGTVACRNNSGTNTYTYIDDYPAGARQVFYRLQIVDKDGGIKESNIIRFNLDSHLTITVSTDVAKGTVLISGQKLQQLRLFNTAGALVKSISLNDQNNVTVNLTGIAAGMYLIRANDAAGNIVTEKIVIP
jgi:N-acetylneuraminic acid mutarotase